MDSIARGSFCERMVLPAERGVVGRRRMRNTCGLDCGRQQPRCLSDAELRAEIAGDVQARRSVSSRDWL